jgi:DnaJ-domain-containing protein 1
MVYLKYKRKQQNQLEGQHLSDEPSLSINRDYHKQTKGTNKDYSQIQMDIDNRLEYPDSHRQSKVIFTWNGHDWDAYEVLGVPMGSTQEEIKLAYEAALNRVDEKSQKIIEKAYRSIAQKVG